MSVIGGKKYISRMVSKTVLPSEIIYTIIEFLEIKTLHRLLSISKVGNF
jgi:hypothetical protein